MLKRFVEDGPGKFLHNQEKNYTPSVYQPITGKGKAELHTICLKGPKKACYWSIFSLHEELIYFLILIFSKMPLYSPRFMIFFHKKFDNFLWR